MLRLFVKIRQNLISGSKTGKYFKYAAGEIVLVVIGILLAIQVNNWNENRRVQKEIKNIYQEIVFDLDDDIKELSKSLNRLQASKPVFEKVIADARTVELLDDGLSRIIATYSMTVLNKSGVEKLKSTSAKDRLTLEIINTYNLMESQYILPSEKRMFDISSDFSRYCRNNHDWYPEWMSKKITKDNSSKALQNYFVNDKLYRNYVIEYNHQAYNNYLPSLKYFIKELKILKSKIEAEIE